jgi:hypothetical protein
MTTKEKQYRQTACDGPSRRAVLTAGAAIAVFGLPIEASVNLAENASRAETAILAVLRHREAAIQLGNAAQASWPHLGDRKQILADTLDDLGMDGDTAVRAGVVEIASQLSQRIQDDFATGRTVMLDGWLLSLIETRLYALAALAQY